MNHALTYIACSSLPVSVEKAFAYHERTGSLRRLIPPWLNARIEHSDDSLEVGSRVVVKTTVAGVPVRWVARHTHYDPPTSFADTQISGPFESWDHRHEFQQMGPPADVILPADRGTPNQAGQFSTLRDSITYRLPFGFAGRVLGGGVALRRLETMFAFRHRLTRDDLSLLASYPDTPMTVAISGSSGLVGSDLGSMLTLLGHSVRPIVRAPQQGDTAIAAWHSHSEASKLGEVDAVVHLAGKPIAGERWSDAVKREIRDSRVDLTEQLCHTLASLDRKPKVLVCASATGFYGDRGDETVDEDSQIGTGFLAEVAGQWEQACQVAVDAGIRVVHVRLGVVLSPKDGALAKMIRPAKFAAGSLGSGKQWWSWIALDDAIGAIYHAIMTPSLSGPVNLVSPEPCTNRQFASTLAGTLHRPALFPAPAFVLRLGLGEMADSLLLGSTRVSPTKLVESNYRFRFTELGDALRFCLGRDRLESAE